MEDAASAGAGGVGAGLREVRERLGWRLADAAETLRIRPEYLQAIEAGDLQALPGVAYRTGFVRTYARALGLDPEEILRRFRAEGELGGSQKAEMKFIAHVPDRGVPKGPLVMLGVVVLMISYGLWYHYSATQRRLAAQVPAVPAELAPLAVPPKIAVSPVIPAPAATPPAATVATPPAAATPAAAPASPAPASAQAAAPAPPGAGMVITATQDAWVEVHDATGNILFSKVLHAGDSWPVPQEPGLTLTTGNAGGTEIIANGVAGAPLGAPSAVLHGYALTPPAPALDNAAAPATAAPAVPAPAAPVTPPAAAAPGKQN